MGIESTSTTVTIAMSVLQPKPCPDCGCDKMLTKRPDVKIRLADMISDVIPNVDLLVTANTE